MAIKDWLKKGKDGSEESIKFKRLQTVVDKCFDDTKDQRDEMSRFLKRYKGEWWEKGALKDTDSTIVANLLFSTVMTIAPLITDNRPIWSIRSRKPYLQNYFDGLSLALEYLWDKLDMDAVTFKWILDALVMKVGIVKLYFDPEAEFGGEHKVEVVDPRLFFVAPGYDDIWDAPLCGTRIRKPLSWIYSKYPENAKKVKPDQDDEKFPDDAETWELENKYATVYEVWLKDDQAEDYFIRIDGDKEISATKDDEGSEKRSRPKYPNGRIVVFTKETVLEDKPSAYQHSKPPYVALYDYIVPHSFIGMGEGDQIEELNKSYNRSLQLLDNYTRYRCDPPIFADTNCGVDIEDLKKQIPAGGGIFAANFAAMPQGKPILVGDIGNFDQAVLQYMTGLSKLVEEISGVTDITKGLTTKSQRQSATEISTLIESSYTRTRQRVRNFEWSVKRLLYIILCNSQQFYTEPREFSLGRDDKIDYYTVGSSNAQVAETIGTPKAPEQMEGMPQEEVDKNEQTEKDYMRFVEEFGDVDPVYAEFDLEIQTNSTLPMDKQSLANLFLRLLEMAGGNPVTGMPMWEAALSALRIPRYKQIIQDMKDNFEKSNQQPGGQPGPETGGPEGMMAQLMSAQGGPPQ
jgi:hypothetical protein